MNYGVNSMANLLLRMAKERQADIIKCPDCQGEGWLDCAPYAGRKKCPHCYFGFVTVEQAMERILTR